jgi:abscisic-aldehyde oxidase
VKQVEVNLLTGETTILRSDIIYDCGKSLNPAVDLGQVSWIPVTQKLDS